MARKISSQKCNTRGSQRKNEPTTKTKQRKDKKHTILDSQPEPKPKPITMPEHYKCKNQPESQDFEPVESESRSDTEEESLATGAIMFRMPWDVQCPNWDCDMYFREGSILLSTTSGSSENFSKEEQKYRFSMDGKYARFNCPNCDRKVVIKEGGHKAPRYHKGMKPNLKNRMTRREFKDNAALERKAATAEKGMSAAGVLKAARLRDRMW